MSQVKHYTVRFYGGPIGLNGEHAQIHLFGEHNKLMGWINFKEKGTEKADHLGDHIVMDLAIDLLPSTLQVLNNEAPIYYYWQKQLERAYFGTGQEPVGESEGK